MALSGPVVHIVGARPQFVKVAVLYRTSPSGIDNLMIHTGQHYDPGLSDVFFTELELPTPDYHLGVGSGTHGQQTAAMLTGIESVLFSLPMGTVVVYGDTNSTLAGALAAKKVGWPVVHVEAGLRSFDRRMPEELNRVAVDHLSDLLLCPTDVAYRQLVDEGLGKRSVVTGDVMLDACYHARQRALTETDIGLWLAGQTKIPEHLNGDLSGRLVPQHYVLATLHRAANTDDDRRLTTLLTTLDDLPWPVIMPVHPRTRQAMARIGYSPKGHLRLIEPVGYLDFAALMSGCRHIVTDSGGVQKEAYFYQKQCTTMRAATEWTETLLDGWNQLVDANPEALRASLERPEPASVPQLDLFGGGHSGAKSWASIEHGAW